MSLNHTVTAPPPGGVDLSALLTDEHRAFLSGLPGRTAMFRGFTMLGEDDPDPDDEDQDDDDLVELDPEDRVKIGDKVMTVADLQKIAAREKRQGKKAGASALVKRLGYETEEELEAAIAAAGNSAPAKPAADADADAEIARKRTQRDQVDAEKQRKKERRLDLRGALRDEGVSRDDLDAAEALLDRMVERDYEEDDLPDYVDELRRTRAGKALFDVDDDDETPTERRTAATIPKGRPKGKPKPPAKPAGAGGLARAQRKGWIKAD